MSPKQTTDAIDRETALERLDGDVELYEEILTVFRSSTPSEFGRLSASLDTPTLNPAIRELVQRHSHSIKSASLSIGAHHAASCALDVERSAQTAPLEELARKSGALGVALDAVFAWIDRAKEPETV